MKTIISLAAALLLTGCANNDQSNCVNDCNIGGGGGYVPAPVYYGAPAYYPRIYGGYYRGYRGRGRGYRGHRRGFHGRGAVIIHR